ncbi:hypothetical protein L226DRAFT_220497 [Lentinus tigrinus ALCF2SS1-7]|uniref:uncharacterized protein n=1 Tax=Lentinus tigrinus ALCF2SS1-7 TaxID=1328758 RepID=UPI001165DDC0|nr:hypothetical protein L226DRAFT_220497 [Lentinus tigrinus ALCF2SS1-7]
MTPPRSRRATDSSASTQNIAERCRKPLPAKPLVSARSTIAASFRRPGCPTGTCPPLQARLPTTVGSDSKHPVGLRWPHDQLHVHRTIDANQHLVALLGPILCCTPESISESANLPDVDALRSLGNVSPPLLSSESSPSSPPVMVVSSMNSTKPTRDHVPGSATCALRSTKTSRPGNVQTLTVTLPSEAHCGQSTAGMGSPNPSLIVQRRCASQPPSAILSSRWQSDRTRFGINLARRAQFELLLGH